MTLSSVETSFIIWVVLALFSVLAYIGKLAVGQLKRIADTVNKMEKDLSVLANDHINLKDEVKEVKKRVSKLEEY